MTDPIYENQRNALIPEAELVANRLSGASPKFGTSDYEKWAGVWNGHFSSAMERLWDRRNRQNMWCVTNITTVAPGANTLILIDGGR